MSSIRSWLGLVLLALMFTIRVQPASASDGELPISVSHDSFGLHVHGFHRGNSWPEVPFGFIRLWDSATQWRQLEIRDGDWDFSTLDAYVDAAESSGVKILLTLGQTPAWAAKDRDSRSAYAPGASSPPKRLADWRDYVRTLAERYRGRILHWEVWNEVNVPKFWSGTYQELAELERIAVEELKAVEPQNVILTPSIQGGAYTQLQRYLEAGGGQHADVVSYHFYALREEPEEVIERIQKVREILAEFDLQSKPLWNTEIGWLLANSDEKFGPSEKIAWARWKRVSFEEAAGLVIRAFLASFSQGVDRVFWYSWDNKAMGLTEDAGRTMKPGANGFHAAYAWLVDTSFYGCLSTDEIWLCRARKANRDRYLVWSHTVQEMIVPREWMVDTLVKLDGSSKEISPEQIIELSKEPQLLTAGDVEYVPLASKSRVLAPRAARKRPSSASVSGSGNSGGGSGKAWGH